MSFEPEFGLNKDEVETNETGNTATKVGGESEADSPETDYSQTEDKTQHDKKTWKRYGAVVAAAAVLGYGANSLLDNGSETEQSSSPTPIEASDDSSEITGTEQDLSLPDDYDHELIPDDQEDSDGTETRNSDFESITGNRAIDEHLFVNSGLSTVEEFKEEWEYEKDNKIDYKVKNYQNGIDAHNSMRDDFTSKVSAIKSGEEFADRGDYREMSVLDGLTLVFTSETGHHTFVLEDPVVYGYKLGDAVVWHRKVRDNQNFLFLFSDGESVHTIDYLNDKGIGVSTYTDERASELKLRAAFVEEDGVDVEKAQLQVEQVNDEDRISFELTNGKTTEFTHSEEDAGYNEIVERLADGSRYASSLQVLDDINN